MHDLLVPEIADPENYERQQRWLKRGDTLKEEALNEKLAQAELAKSHEEAVEKVKAEAQELASKQKEESSKKTLD